MTVKLTHQKINTWDSDLNDWDLTQCGDFFIDDDTVQVGAIYCGSDPGSIPYFRVV